MPAMQYQNPTLILNILHREFPDIALEINSRINGVAPALKVGDSKMPLIVNSFLATTQINHPEWYKEDRLAVRLSGEDTRLCKITEIREMLISVVLLFFHPARIKGIDPGRAKPGLLKELAGLTSCTHVVLSQNLATAVLRYRAYKGFKTEVDYLFEQIKNTLPN